MPLSQSDGEISFLISHHIPSVAIIIAEDYQIKR